MEIVVKISNPLTWRLRTKLIIGAAALAAVVAVIVYLMIPRPLTQADIAKGRAQCEAQGLTIVDVPSEHGPVLWNNGSVATYAAEQLDGVLGTCQVERSSSGMVVGFFFTS